jgi:D-psicose/D-tagatose/L-ribulose 3-epimerase
MRIGVNTLIWSAGFDQSNLPLLGLLKEHGFDGVELPVFEPATFPAAAVRKGLEANGLGCTVCSIVARGLNLVSDDADVRRKTQIHIEDTVKVTAELGGRILDGPLYTPVGYLPGRRRTADEWKRAVEAYQSMGPMLARHGVTLALEPLNRFETYFLNTAADCRALCDAVDHPNVGISFDTFHANIEEKDIAAGYRTVGRHLKHVQTSENDRGIPGSGHVDWPAVFRALRAVGYDEWLMIESFGFNLGELSAAVAIWRDIERTPDVIAFEGIKFLRKHFKRAGQPRRARRSSAKTAKSRRR